MKRVIFLVAITVGFFTGCSTVPLEPREVSDAAKAFKTPPEGESGLYVYRDSFVGQALKKDVYVDNKCLGRTSNKVFFYQKLKANQEHVIATESEFSPNTLTINTQSGENYFVRQYIKMGLVVGGADLELVEDEKAKNVIVGLDMAQKGMCSSMPKNSLSNQQKSKPVPTKEASKEKNKNSWE